MEQRICHHVSQTNKKRTEQEVALSNNIPKKVNGFVGYAVSRLIKKIEKEEKTASLDDYEDNRSELESILVVVKSVRILHRDALLNGHYSSNYYS